MVLETFIQPTKRNFKLIHYHGQSISDRYGYRVTSTTTRWKGLTVKFVTGKKQ